MLPRTVILEGAMKTTFLLVLVLVFFGSSPSWPAGKSPGHEKLGYRDDDNDGKNDLVNGLRCSCFHPGKG